jgi:hypothetical protein
MHERAGPGGVHVGPPDVSGNLLARGQLLLNLAVLFRLVPGGFDDLDVVPEFLSLCASALLPLSEIVVGAGRHENHKETLVTRKRLTARSQAYRYRKCADAADDARPRTK